MNIPGPDTGGETEPSLGERANRVIAGPPGRDQSEQERKKSELFHLGPPEKNMSLMTARRLKGILSSREEDVEPDGLGPKSRKDIYETRRQASSDREEGTEGESSKKRM